MPKLSKGKSHALGENLEVLRKIEIDIEADATGGKSVKMPESGEILDVIVQARATSLNGTVQLKDGSANPITDAVIMDTDTVITHAGTIDDAYSTLSKGATLSVVTAVATDRGKVTVLYALR
jgi:hypothetical protein